VRFVADIKRRLPALNCLDVEHFLCSQPTRAILEVDAPPAPVIVGWMATTTVVDSCR